MKYATYVVMFGILFFAFKHVVKPVAKGGLKVVKVAKKVLV